MVVRLKGWRVEESEFDAGGSKSFQIRSGSIQPTMQLMPGDISSETKLLELPLVQYY
jgi:hypothetical protein